MNNKELYEQAVKDGLEFSYFKGEESNPYSENPKDIYWEAEFEVANSDEPSDAIEYFEKLDKNDIPKFISESNASNSSKAVAFEAFLKYMSWCPAPIKVFNPQNGPFSDYFNS